MTTLDIRLDNTTTSHMIRDAIGRYSMHDINAELYRLRNADSPTGYDTTQREYVAELQNAYNNKIITAHRKPTPSEIKWGYGATHYRDFPVSEWLKPNGTLKAWILADDGLRYYR